jgi:hypothetical protein
MYTASLGQRLHDSTLRNDVSALSCRVSTCRVEVFGVVSYDLPDRRFVLDFGATDILVASMRAYEHTSTRAIAKSFRSALVLGSGLWGTFALDTATNCTRKLRTTDYVLRTL